MARNQEKAQALFNRFLSSKIDKEKEDSGRITKRPFLSSECRDLNEADKWRQQILREVGRKVMEIQNAALGEHRLRDLNDEINKLVREKGHWETRIVELGGPNYGKSGPKATDAEGNELEGASGKGQGYRYFGAAKNLPGVKELYEKQAPRTVRRTRHQMFQGITATYYGFQDEDDGRLIKAEISAEEKARQAALQEFQRHEAAKQAVKDTLTSSQDDDAPAFVAHVPLPDQKDIEQAVLAKKKRDLMARYASATLQKDEQEAKELLNKKPRAE
mmetsp:Transcript_459/g.642  ORF Transcript_459/g.642 Transcript_459/m.642 type:complete len:274 (-) Transcript_459:428-1249(-)|eukprot:CAMPEP_0196582408 /NCGR_PEP_ID=MMETSP1081-20130531/38812_1 /TAXON_ID=36882 /ORGANISM="Pyramimonas amylifera, Strain CCMP720" /LENGTH=273 /DNA_ID=CAMNT_0041902959 /DNA_START=44 /DNA_END=865 /DNA_ORIENTATION=+